MTTLLLPIVSGAFAGAVSGALTALWLFRRAQRQAVPEQNTAPDSVLAAQIDHAAAHWSNSQGHPEAAGLVADKLYLLHRVGQRRGWWR